MNSVTVSLTIFACVFGGALLGLLLHATLPEHHLSKETQDIVKLGMGLVGTMAALVLGLLVASAKGSYDAQSAEVTQLSANIALLDRALALYGLETKEIRTILRGAVSRALDQMWSKDASASRSAPRSAGGEILYEKIHALSPQNDAQRSLKSQASSIAVDVAKTRWLMYEQAMISVSTPLLIVLVLWLMRHLCQFWIIRSLQCHCCEQPVCGSAIGFVRHLLDLGNVHALHGTGSDIEPAIARRYRATWPVAEALQSACT